MKLNQVCWVCVALLLSAFGCSSEDNGSPSSDARAANASTQGGASADDWAKAVESARAKGDQETLDKMAKEAWESGDDERFEAAVRTKYELVKSDPKAVLGLTMMKIENADDYVRMMRKAGIEKREKEKAKKERQEQLRKRFADTPYAALADRAFKQLEADRDFSGHPNLVKHDDTLAPKMLHLIGDTVPVGDLKVRLESFGLAKRMLYEKETFSDEKTPLTEPMWGGLVHVENTSDGRVIAPFSYRDSAGIDSWDNRLIGRDLSRRYNRTVVEEGAPYVRSDTELQPRTNATFLIAYEDPKVLNFDYLILKLEVMPSNTGRETHVYFLVPTDKIEGVK